jgi:hypothetical protein
LTLFINNTVNSNKDKDKNKKWVILLTILIQNLVHMVVVFKFTGLLQQINIGIFLQRKNIFDLTVDRNLQELQQQQQQTE